MSVVTAFILPPETASDERYRCSVGSINPQAWRQVKRRECILVDANTGLLAETLRVMVSEFATPERFDAPIVTLWSPTEVERPNITICINTRPLGNPVANAVGP